MSLRWKVNRINNQIFKYPETSMHTVIRFWMDIGYFAHTNAALGLHNYSNTTAPHSHAGLAILTMFVGLVMGTESLTTYSVCTNPVGRRHRRAVLQRLAQLNC